jgi:hypothetical protein
MYGYIFELTNSTEQTHTYGPTAVQPYKKPPAFYGTLRSSSCSYDLIGLCPEPDESSPYSSPIYVEPI